jgi:hypothetical protein
MTASATTPTREKAERARENREYVRSLLNVRQPQFAAALESAARKPRRDHRTVCASSQRSSQPGWGLLAGTGRPTALPAGQTCELRVGPEFFYLGSDAARSPSAAARHRTATRWSPCPPTPSTAS